MRPHSELRIQHEWSDEKIRDFWPDSPDHAYAFRRAADATVEIAAAGASGRLLDVAAAEGTLTCRLSSLGLSATAIDPSAIMIATARGRRSEAGARVDLVRGIAETLPFADETFERVLCHSALDHLADPERGIREMARVARRDGLVVLTFMNYGGLTVRASRLLYRLGRKLAVVAPESEQRLFWDTPVPFEHNFECSLANVSAMCRPYLEPSGAYGVSLGWRLPGWSQLVRRFSFFERWIETLDRIAGPRPALADFVVSVWRPRPRSAWPVDDYRVRPSNPVYQRLVRKEAAYWSEADFAAFFGAASAPPQVNAALTGDPARSWIEDLANRGPFRSAAVLGCDDMRWDAGWLRRGASERLDVYELSPDVIAKVKERLGELARGVQFIEADLNFVELPAETYDCIWTSGTLHLLTNLEHVLDQVRRGLKPGGLFAMHGWVGENSMQYGAERLARINALLAEIPAAYRRLERVEPPSTVFQLSPFTAVRSSDILPILRSHPGFEVVHDAAVGWLFPLTMVVDIDALARERPDLLERLDESEASARADPRLQPALGYVVLRRRD